MFALAFPPLPVALHMFKDVFAEDTLTVADKCLICTITRKTTV
jgi:hypothetical protein